MVKPILDNVSGSIPLGKLTAIYGPSGSGKTTLLNTLSFHLDDIKNATLDGDIFLENKEVTTFLPDSAYVEQEDTLFAQLTVQETLEYGYDFYENKGNKKEEIDKILRVLGLLKVKDTMVGDEFMRGVSGGEKKRVSIGVELIKKPKYIFLDEPTSGLDSF